MIAHRAVWIFILSAVAMTAPVRAQVVPTTKADSALMKMRGALRWVSMGQQGTFE